MQNFNCFPIWLYLVYARGRGCVYCRGITKGHGRRCCNSISAGGRAPTQASKTYTLRDIHKFTVDSQGYKAMHSQWVNRQKMLRLNRSFKGAKKDTDEE